jgi:Ala-tRNA(Pro) deacylase
MDAATSDPASAVLSVLDGLGIPYVRHDHAAVFTVEEALHAWQGIDATHCKNLFLRNKKGTRHYLVVAAHDRAVNLAQVAGLVGDDRLSFGSPERLLRVLGLTPGSVSPFGLINDTEKQVIVVVDAALRTSPRVGFHPNTNTATVVLSGPDFEKFLTSCGQAVRWVDLP